MPWVPFAEPVPQAPLHWTATTGHLLGFEANPAGRVSKTDAPVLLVALDVTEVAVLGTGSKLVAVVNASMRPYPSTLLGSDD